MWSDAKHLGSHRIAVAAAILALLVVVVLAWRRPYSLATWNGCVPTPAPPTPSGTATATPDTTRPGTLDTPAPSPSVTPIPYANVYDLAPDLPERDKGEVIVFRCDGRFELYWLPINVGLDVIPLERGDLIYSWAPPASLVGHQAPPAGTPPEPTPAPSFTPGPPLPTSTPWSYPLATPTTTSFPTNYP